ncbi:MAG: hypothetical protein Q8K36_03020, partial [Alphaproteobacteria bacterium]|nr:hypothetical protein [Alphaproteobacteria bacterium]
MNILPYCGIVLATLFGMNTFLNAQGPDDNVKRFLDRGYRPAYHDCLLFSTIDDLSEIDKDGPIFVQVDELWGLLSTVRAGVNGEGQVIEAARSRYMQIMSIQANPLYDGRIFSCNSKAKDYPSSEIIDLFKKVFPDFMNALELGASHKLFVSFYAFKKEQFKDTDVKFPSTSGPK